MKKTFAAALAAVLGATVAPGATISFEGAKFGPGFTGPLMEAGFTVSKESGDLYVNGYGNPGFDLEGQFLGNKPGGVVQFASPVGALFTFDGLDYSVYGFNGGPDLVGEVLTVAGFRQGTLVGQDQFSSLGSPTLTTYQAKGLAGLSLDRLSIKLNAGRRNGKDFAQAIDNVRLSAAVPEPATWAMFIGGFGLMGASLRRRQRTTVSFA